MFNSEYIFFTLSVLIILLGTVLMVRDDWRTSLCNWYPLLLIGLGALGLWEFFSRAVDIASKRNSELTPFQELGVTQKRSIKEAREAGDAAVLAAVPGPTTGTREDRWNANEH